MVLRIRKGEQQGDPEKMGAGSEETSVLPVSPKLTTKGNDSGPEGGSKVPVSSKGIVRERILVLRRNTVTAEERPIVKRKN